MKVVYTPAHLLHDPQVELEHSKAQQPFEHTGRAEAIRAVLAADKRFRFVDPTEWGTTPIEAVHESGLVRFLETAWRDFNVAHPGTREVVPDVFAMQRLRDGMEPGREPASIDGRLGFWCFETTTPLTETTYEAARGAVDTALTATAAVLGGDRAAYALCRPPGHHAARSLYGGYCFFNNAAISAHHIASTTGARVALLDVDYHHGNGSQQIFYGRDDVVYLSLHGDPSTAYPYSVGFADEVGSGRGRGFTMNHPLPPGTDDDRYVHTLEVARDQIAASGAEVVVVSLGLDTFITDPICDFAVTTDGMRRCGAVVATLDMPTVVVQEGGYDVDALGRNVQAWLEGLGV